MTSSLLEFRSVERRFKDGDDIVFALRDASFSIDLGEFVAVMGPSGSGKSTLLNLAGGLDVPTSGHVLVNGRDLSAMNVGELADVRRQTVGYVFQRLNLLPTLTVVENVMMPMELNGVSRGSPRRGPIGARRSRYRRPCRSLPRRRIGRSATACRDRSSDRR